MLKLPGPVYSCFRVNVCFTVAHGPIGSIRDLYRTLYSVYKVCIHIYIYIYRIGRTLEGTLVTCCVEVSETKTHGTSEDRLSAAPNASRIPM